MSLVLVETHQRVGLARLNRPEALNALNAALIAELNAALDRFEADAAIGCVVITGSAKAFAAGADIKEMQGRGYADLLKDDFVAAWERVTAMRKPVIAAVGGLCLGGGCELATMCDFIIAADDARFGQPEVKLGLMPGAGATQRLARLVGRAKAMDLCLTGRMMDAMEAERAGLVARVAPAAELVDVALKAAATIAALSQPAVMLIKESVARSEEVGLREGVRAERRLFQSLFALEDAREGMAAFVEKRPPAFRNR